MAASATARRSKRWRAASMCWSPHPAACSTTWTSRHAALDGVETLVLDEADQMLDMGFIQPIRRIISKISMKRQTLFFSATMPKEIGRLAAEMLQNPVKVSVTPAATTVERVRQHVYLVDAKAKRSLLVELFANPELTRTIVFTRTKRGADKVARHLEEAGISNAAIHGNKSQGQRQAALAAFKASRIRALVATDVAARGIDIELVTHVVNFELPNVPESYVHRIGRTARAGAEGVAISLCDAEEREFLRDIEHLTRQSIPATDRRRDPTLPPDRGPPRQPQAAARQPRRRCRQGGKPARRAQPALRAPGTPPGQACRRPARHDRNGSDSMAAIAAPSGRAHATRRRRRGESYADQVANGASLSNVAFLTAPSRPAHASRAMQLSATTAARPSPVGMAIEVAQVRGGQRRPKRRQERRKTLLVSGWRLSRSLAQDRFLIEANGSISDDLAPGAKQPLKRPGGFILWPARAFAITRGRPIRPATAAG